MTRFLITTSDERAWRRDVPVLFLGEWCRRADRRDAWQHLDAEVVPYHWDDRTQCYNDYLYLKALYEDMLRRVADALNARHGTTYSVRYWRIVVGPWLYLFTHTLFDRWTMVERAADAYDIDQTVIVDESAGRRVPRSLLEMNPDSVSWNHYLFGAAIRQANRIPWRDVPAADLPPPQPAVVLPPSAHVRARLPRAVHRLAASVQRVFTRDTEPLVIQTYLPPFQEIKLQVALGQIPKLWRTPSVPLVDASAVQRSGFKVPSHGEDRFERFLCSMVPEQIPTIYLEGYGDLCRAVDALPWPRRPSVIFTSNLFQFCEPFQAWAAEQVEANVPLVLGQHGGLMGSAKWHSSEDHQAAIADRLITWGWADERPATYPGLVLTNVGKASRTWNPRGTLLLVSTPVRLMGYKSNSSPLGATQAESFLQEQMRFIAALAPEPRSSLIIRLRKSQDERMQSRFCERLGHAFPDAELDDSTGPIEPRIRACRLFTYSCNSTGYLETLARDIPTLIFWNPQYFELRAEVKSSFDLLNGVGIFHHTPEAAAEHVNRVWSDVAAWWNEPAVQAARREFCSQHARMPTNPICFLRDALRTVRHVPIGDAGSVAASAASAGRHR